MVVLDGQRTLRLGVEIRLLGPIAVVVDGRPVDIPQARARSVLAALACNPGVPVSHGTLTDRVWGSRQVPATARQALMNYISQLRRLLGDSIVTGGGYRLDVDPDRIDLVRFQRLVSASWGANGDRALDEALALWRGDPFTGIDLEGVSELSAELVEQYLVSVERRCDRDLALGSAVEGVARLSGLAARYPFRESLWACLLTSLSALGRGAEALARYDEIRRRLASELGTAPSAELQAIHQRILAGAPLPLGRTRFAD